MAHEIDMSNGRANMAFVGNRKDIWHGLGHEITPDDSLDDCVRKAGLDWRVIQCPSYAALASTDFDHIPAADRFREVPDNFFHCRSDTGAVLGFATDSYRVHQPREMVDFMRQFVGVDSRFKIDTLGSLKGGRVIWAMASFADEFTIANDKHKARLLITTSFDSTMATIAKATMTRVVCNNTLSMSLYDSSAEVRVRHNTKFDGQAAAAKLGAIAQGFTQYKALGDAMLQVQLSAKEISDFFKSLLDIPFDAKQEDVSTKKLNNFEALKRAYGDTVQEGTAPLTSWAALNAVTRFVDHTKHIKNTANPESRVLSAEFGSGANMKAKALELLIPAAKLKVAA